MSMGMEMIVWFCFYMEVFGILKCFLIFNWGFGFVLWCLKLLWEFDISGCLWVIDVVFLEIGE